MRYKEIKSGFIKEKIKGRDWSERKYIKDLMCLEEAILYGCSGFAHSMLIHHLKRQYKNEFYQIYKELKPKEFNDYFKRERGLENKLKKEKSQREAKRKSEKEILKEEWLALGGRLH